MAEKAGPDARGVIFDALRSAGTVIEADEARMRREAAELLSDVESARPPLLCADPVEAFMGRFEQDRVVGTTCEALARAADLPGAVNRYLERHRLPGRVRVQEAVALRALDWSGLEIDADVSPDGAVAVGWAEYGVAETGSVAVHSGPDAPVLLNFLPLYLILAVPRSRILPFLDDYAEIAARLARESSTPRNMCLITGASGTTDIEGVLVKGAHGPKHLHVVVVADA